MRITAIQTVTTALLATLATLLSPTPAIAQFQSASSQFLKAVRDSDAAEANKQLSGNTPTLIDTRDKTSGEVALHIVIGRRDLGWTAFILQKGAKTDLKDRNGNTPLMLAAQLGFAEGAQLLIKQRAKVDEANNSGETPLIRAVQLRDVRMVRLLLDAGASADRRDTLAGMSARDYAEQDGRMANILKLIQDADKKKPTPPKIGP